MGNVIALPRHVAGDNPFDKFNTPNSPILFPVGEREVGWFVNDALGFMRTNEHKAIVRFTSRGSGAVLLNIVGNGYKLVHNRELFVRVEDAMMNEMLPEHLYDVRVEDKIGSYGRICYRQYTFPSIRCHLPSVRSDIGFRIIVQNGYGGSGLRIIAGAIDYYCRNGMVIGDYISTYKKHTSGLVVSDLTTRIKDAIALFSGIQDTWGKWSRTPVKHDTTMALFDAVSTSKKMREGLVDQYAREQEARGSNLWSVYSALTYYSSHNDGNFALRRTVEEQDTVTQTMLARELNVSKWIKTTEWKALEMQYG
jgi:hypothetical protein